MPKSSNSWSWALEHDGCFSVASLRTRLDAAILQLSCSFQTVWSKEVPSKVNFLTVRIQHERLPTLINLQRRNIPLLSALCVFCQKELESEEHVFLSCPIARYLLPQIKNWWCIQDDIPSSIKDLLNWGDLAGSQGSRLSYFFGGDSSILLVTLGTKKQDLF